MVDKGRSVATKRQNGRANKDVERFNDHGHVQSQPSIEQPTITYKSGASSGRNIVVECSN